MVASWSWHKYTEITTYGSLTIHLKKFTFALKKSIRGVSEKPEKLEHTKNI